ncbi:hypothetical protein E4T66_11740 [Sinimarinibacterium sp. CAU 1509]|uniref:hypothetical protein n=1 Tax=Sinimarinibacterium sp. CAU 1509 TaxID=2562283 RepID=UPI0010AB971B|nr:hypothetical protein [Sinimarinibacterium sp. CAU 1509]TJY59848.1 hypothetical protein E4T66_11740 [Sinimarinibacterium sp. CAU 1509]
MRYVLVAVLGLLFSSCATQATMTIYSQPPGAYITEIGTEMALGIAPVVSYYNESALRANRSDAQGCYLIKGFEAQWVSGARAASTEAIRLCKGTTNNYIWTITRNSDDPGLDKDLQFALQIQTLLTQQQQAQAAQDAAAAALIGAFSAAQQADAPMRCRSYSVGNTVQTNCK